MKFKAVIFDLDGTLADTESHWMEREKKLFAELGIERTPELVARIIGRSLSGIASLLKDEYRLALTHEQLVDAIVNTSEVIYTRYADPMPGAGELLQKLRATPVKMAIASGSSLKRIELLVKRFGWEDHFDHLISSDHVDLVSKPDPAIYRYAAKILRLEPNQCVAVEDSVNGLRSAQGAGMECIAVPDAGWSHGDFSSSELTAKTLADPAILNFLGI